MRCFAFLYKYSRKDLCWWMGDLLALFTVSVYMCNDQLQKSEITDAVGCTTAATTSVTDRHAGKLCRNFWDVLCLAEKWQWSKREMSALKVESALKGVIHQSKERHSAFSVPLKQLADHFLNYWERRATGCCEGSFLRFHLRAYLNSSY